MTHENYMKLKCVSLNNVLSEHCRVSFIDHSWRYCPVMHLSGVTVELMIAYKT